MPKWYGLQGLIIIITASPVALDLLYSMHGRNGLLVALSCLLACCTAGLPSCLLYCWVAELLAVLLGCRVACCTAWLPSRSLLLFMCGS
jgi:hypothetical protein